ncbi:hypothetical protein ACC672_37435, partial [Rhizobium ruizarguesonis]
LAADLAGGQGVLSGGAAATFQPDGSSGNDPVNITATQMSLDVDNNVSTRTRNSRSSPARPA